MTPYGCSKVSPDFLVLGGYLMLVSILVSTSEDTSGGLHPGQGPSSKAVVWLIFGAAILCLVAAEYVQIVHKHCHRAYLCHAFMLHCSWTF